MKYNVAHFGVGYNVARDRNDSFVLCVTRAFRPVNEGIRFICRLVLRGQQEWVFDRGILTGIM